MADVIVIGGGIAGLNVSLFTQKAELDTVVFDTGASQIKRVSEIHNYLGNTNSSGDQLIEQYREQVNSIGVKLMDEEVVSVKKTGESFAVQTATETYTAKYVVIATNVNTQLVSDLGFEVVENEKMPNGRGKKVPGVTWEGETNIENLYIAGLLAGIPSQSIIAAGQGAAVGVNIARKATGKTYMWHDV